MFLNNVLGNQKLSQVNLEKPCCIFTGLFKDFWAMINPWLLINLDLLAQFFGLLNYQIGLKISFTRESLSLLNVPD